MNTVRWFAIPFALLAVSNFGKPLMADEGVGFVFMGTRLTGTPNWIAAWSFAAYLATYAAALWREKGYALPMGIAYACYVAINMAWFQLRTAPHENNPLFGLVYAAIALAVSWGAVAAMLRNGYAEKDSAPGRLLLRSFALLFGLMALSNALKPFVYSQNTGFVLFGQRLAGDANVAAALCFSAFLASYAFLIWRERRAAIPVGTLYALYVIANIVMWNFRKPEGADLPVLFGIGYLICAIGVSGGAALLLHRHAERFT